MVAGFLLLTASLFVNNSVYGVLLQTFDDPTPTGPDEFGESVALDGNRVLVGVPSNTFSSSEPGDAHLFDATTGLLLQTFDNPTPKNRDEFGTSVALDGNRVLVGAPGDDASGQNVGQAHLFDATTGMLLQTFDDPTPTGSDQFGTSVALEGNRALVGAPGDDTTGDGVGQAHLFDGVTGLLLQTFDDPAPAPNNLDAFGTSVALEGNRVLVGSPSIFPLSSSFGRAHLFDATTGMLLQTFSDPTPSIGHDFGGAVALDANRALVGVPTSIFLEPSLAQVHLFDATTGLLLQTFDDPTAPTGFNNAFGDSVALDANRVLVGDPFEDAAGFRVGQAHLFDATTGLLLETFNDPTPTGSDMFGISLALDGNRALVGAHNDNTEGRNVGQVHLFGPPFGGMPIGGELIPIDTTSLLLAGTQMTASWIIPVIVAGAGIGIVIARKL